MRPGAVAVVALVRVAVMVPSVIGYVSTQTSSWVAPPHRITGFRRSTCPRRSLGRCRAQPSVAIKGGGSAAGGGGDSTEPAAKPPLKVTGGVHDGCVRGDK